MDLSGIPFPYENKKGGDSMAEIPNRTLQRGLEMLETLSAHPQGIALCDLTRAMGLPRTTAYNLLQTLVYLGYAVPSADGGKYVLSSRTFEIGSVWMRDQDDMPMLREGMRQVQSVLNETVHLGVRSGNEMLYIDKLDSTRAIRMTSRIGTRAPLYCTALGKALLSGMTDEQIRRLYGQEELKAYTAHTITDVDRLLEQIGEVRRNGYAVEREENEPNVCCVAVPLCSAAGEAVYAMSVSAPSFRMEETELRHSEEMLTSVRQKLEPYLQTV